MAKPLVSVIVTTRNNSATLAACLESIKEQTYQGIELIVVDNSSTDSTVEIAKQFTKHVLNHGPERSAQRNHGVATATGEHVLIIDSDMELSSEVVEQCVTAVSAGTRAIIIPETSFGEGFWAKCKALERSFYDGVDWIEAPRLFERALYQEVGGYDEEMVGGEDWDLGSRVRQKTMVGRIKARIMHNEGRPTFKSIVGKRAYYTKGFNRMYNKAAAAPRSKVSQVLGTYGLFLSKPAKTFKNPLVGAGTLVMKTAEFGAIGWSLVTSKQMAIKTKA